MVETAVHVLESRKGLSVRVYIPGRIPAFVVSVIVIEEADKLFPAVRSGGTTAIVTSHMPSKSNVMVTDVAGISS